MNFLSKLKYKVRVDECDLYTATKMSPSLVFLTMVFLVTLNLNHVHVQSLFFNFTHFDSQNENNIILGNSDAYFSEGQIQLTQNIQASVGRVSYYKPVPLRNNHTNQVTNFTTHFSFNITQVNPSFSDGFAFLLEPFNEITADAPPRSSGACLGLLSDTINIKNSCNASSQMFVAVEFDTFNNTWDPDNHHVGIDNNSIVSLRTFNVSGGLINRSSIGHAWITYNSFTNNLSVYLTYEPNPVFSGQSNLSYIIDLTSTLPPTVRVGFSATTGMYTELHTIYSWDFNSTLEDDINISVPANKTGPVIKAKSNAAFVGGLVAGFSVLIFGLGALVYIRWRRRRYDDDSSDVDDKYDNETGPRRFTYTELSRATNNFSDKGKLGEGGFGCVYKGFLTGLSKDIAVKKISRDSKQGKKEFVSEVKIISRLRHKNLVQLLGWCHERKELLLVYEYMPNGSLDSHLYKRDQRNTILPWTERYRIAQGLASALLYLHEEWEQCVLHRDIKPSNVMLDSNFNAKLGDFGLARLVDHNLGSQTTVLAGTIGYLAPECVVTGKTSKESDVYSFGVVALEIACGRRPVLSNEEESKVSIIEWVWALHGEGRLLEAVDERLKGEFDSQEIERLMIVGLWCCQSDNTLRPSIRQVINVLYLESPLPSLPMKLPVPVYGSASMNANAFNITTSTSSGFTGTSSGTKSCPSQSIISGASPLLSENAIV